MRPKPKPRPMTDHDRDVRYIKRWDRLRRVYGLKPAAIVDSFECERKVAA